MDAINESCEKIEVQVTRDGLQKKYIDALEELERKYEI